MGDDQIEKCLQEIHSKLVAAWTGNRCLVCPLAELAALAAATLTFYQEQQREMKPTFDRWGYPVIARRVLTTMAPKTPDPYRYD